MVTGQGAGALSDVRVYLMAGADQLPLHDATTNYGGVFSFPGIAPGSYTLRLALPGWQTKFLDGVEVAAGGKVNIPVELTPQVNVLNPAPEPQLLNRDRWWGTSFDDINIDQLPTSRSVWSLLEGQAMSTTTQTNDVSQLETGTPSLFGAHGASWTENQYLYNGFNTTDPYVTGRALVDPDFAALSSVTDVIGSKPANFGAAGSNVILSVPEPQNSLHGQLGLFFSDRALEANNQSAPLTAEGFPGSERMNHLYDGNAQVGGALPFGRVTWPFFVAFSTQQLSKDLGGFGAPIDAHADHILIELTPYQHGGRRLNLLYSGQQEFNSHDGAAIGVAPDATNRRNDNFHQFQGRWLDALSPTTVWEAGFGVTHAILSSGLDNSSGGGVLGTSTLDLPSSTLTGSAPLAQSGQRTRYEANSTFQTIYKGFLGSHAFTFGGDFNGSTMSNRWFALASPNGIPMQQITVSGAGAQVIEWNTPATSRSAEQDFSLFVQDGWRPVRWLQVPLGLRLDTSTGKADGANNRISWTTIEPRAGVVFPVPHLHALVLNAGYARYGHMLQGQYLDYGNPAALGGRMFAWNDGNHDGIAQPSEIGQLQRVFGGPVSGIAHNISRPYSDEITAGFEARIGKYYQIRARGFLRYDHRLIQSTDTGVPLSDYTPTQVNDPGVFAFNTDTSYRTLTLYNEMPSALGHDYDTLENPAGLRARAKGVDVEMSFRSGDDRWWVNGAFTAMATQQSTNTSNSVFSNDTGVLNLLGNDPNNLVNNLGLSYFDRGKFGKFEVLYHFPWGLHAGAVVRYLDGLPYSPELLVTGFNQGPFFVLGVPRNDFVGLRTNFYAEADLRIAKKIVLPRGVLNLDADMFNLQNQSKNTLERDISDSLLHRRLPLAIQSPFTVRLGGQWNF